MGIYRNHTIALIYSTMLLNAVNKLTPCYRLDRGEGAGRCSDPWRRIDRRAHEFVGLR